VTAFLTASVGSGLLIAAGVLMLLALIPVVWSIVDVVRRPPTQVTASQKTMWTIGMAVSWVFLPPLAGLWALWYLLVLRRRFNISLKAGLSQATWDPYQETDGGRPTDLPPAAWYTDPGGSSSERWWDGRGWTTHLRPPTVARTT